MSGTEGRHACRSAHGGDFALPGAEASYAPDLALEPRHIEVRLRFDLEAQRAEGSVTTTVRANRAGAQALQLDAVALQDVAVATAGVDWRYDGRALHLSWPKPFQPGQERKVEVRYAVVSPATGMRFSRPDEAYPDRPLFVGTDHETERARYWLPCVDYPAVRTTIDFHLTAARDLTILANGVLVGEKEVRGGLKTAHWRLDHPCPSYLCCLAIGRFTRCDHGEVGGRPIAYFATDNHTAADLKRSFGKTPAMMRWMEKRLGRPFPYPKYFQIALPQFGGAMENISLVTWDDLHLCDAALLPETGQRVDQINLHEMAHSYFGDDVVCRHFEHSWLKESWATYMETVWLQENAEPEVAEYDLHVNAETYFEEADKRYVRPLVTRTYNSSWDLFDAHLYPGGAWRLHMLRHLVGDDAFWAATTDYLKTYSGKVVETDDFRRKVEEHAGLNLTRFFDQWIHGKGYPKLKATLKQDAAKDEATLTVEQTQADEKTGVKLFAFPLEVDLEDGGGVRTIALEIAEKRTVAVLPVRGQLRRVTFDPRDKALFRLEFQPGDGLLQRELEEGPLRARIRAAAELIRTGTPANLEAVGAAMAKESSWGVRASVAGELGGSGHAAAVGPLRALLLAEEDPRAQRFVASACGRLRDPRLRAALLAFLERDPPPRAAAAALEALGLQRDERDLELLLAETTREDLHHLGAAGALRGLGSLRSLRALALLEGRLAYGMLPEKARTAAVDGFGRCARLLDREAKERAVHALADLTRDPSERVRVRAAQELGDLGLAAAIPALESLRRREPLQVGARIDRILARLRKGPEGEETTKLREQVEKLEERLRKLDDRLQDLEARTEPGTDYRGPGASRA